MGKKDSETKVMDLVMQPAPPKKPLSAFFLFRGEVYEDVKAKNPGAKITQLTKIISERWGRVDEATKNRLQADYQKNKTKYEEEKETYEREHGKIERKKKKVTKKAK